LSVPSSWFLYRLLTHTLDLPTKLCVLLCTCAQVVAACIMSACTHATLGSLMAGFWNATGEDQFCECALGCKTWLYSAPLSRERLRPEGVRAGSFALYLRLVCLACMKNPASVFY